MDFVSIEEKGKRVFSKFPKTRRFFKKIYQFGIYTISKDKIKSEGNIVRISPDDKHEYFYGYYDKSPWDATDRYMLALEVNNAHKVPDSTEEAKIVVFDTHNNNKKIEIGTTHCWNSQQACMEQWLGPDFKTKIIYNDFREGKYVSVIYDFKEKKELKVLDKPVYDVAKDGSFALTLDFSRLHRLRKGYGYANIAEETKKEKCPEKPCVWKIDLKSGIITEIIKYSDLKNFETRDEMQNAEHKVNHLMISPNGKRFMVLHRWFKHGEKFTRLVTLNVDGTDLYNLSDDNFVSHCCWKNDNEILSFLNKKDTGKHYYLMKDKTSEYKLLWPELNTDGHCTYSPDGKYVITDTYPNNKRIASVYLCNEESNSSERIARVFSPFKYDNDTRCDLHPRWNRNSNEICIDSVHEGKKELYIMRVKNNTVNNKPITVSVVIPTHNRADLVSRAIKSVLEQTYPIKEIHVISDGSDDNTDEVVNSIKKDKKIIHYHSYHPAKGGNYARNLGIKESTGDVIAFLDDDDEWHKDKIEKQINVMKLDSNIGLVCTAINRIFVEQEISNPYVPTPKYDCKKEILLKNCIGSTTTIMIKRDLFSKTGLFDENLPALQDYDMWVRLCQITKVGLVKEPCVEYYNYDNSNQISRNTQKYIEAEKKISEKYKDLINKLSKKEQKQRKCYFDMLLSKKGMRNKQKRIAIHYGFKSILDKPCKSSIMCFLASFIPYKISMRIQNIIGNKGVN